MARVLQRRLHGCAATLALGAMLTIGAMSCTSGSEPPSDTNIGGVEAVHKVEQSIISGNAALLAFQDPNEGVVLMRPDGCRSTGFDRAVKAWKVNCDVSVLLDGEVTQTLDDVKYLVDDKSGFVAPDN